jgi:predicted enzyme related to lactoylglutathione lyase
MVKTYGLTHIALAAKDAKRSFEFYRKLFGVIAVYDQGGWIRCRRRAHATSSCSTKAHCASEKPVVSRISFRLVGPKDIDAAADTVKRAGGKILDKGEFCPGEPFIFQRSE